MEKLVYTIWGDDERPVDEGLVAALGALAGLAGLQLNLPDPAFCKGQEPIRNLLPAFDGLVSLWLSSRRDRHPVEAILATRCAGFHGYAVCESTPMRPALPAPDARGRVDALSQVCLLRKPDTLPYALWLSTWIDSHTEVAIARQGTIAYVQNIVQCALTDGAPPLHGIVEECYPPVAYADLAVFFGAADNPAALQDNVTALMASTARFAPLTSLDRIFTARHLPHGGEPFDSATPAQRTHG